MKILFVTNGYPTLKHPEYCVFTKEQIENILLLHNDIQSNIYFINAREKGKLEYIRAIPRLFKLIREHDIIHAFHGLSLILVFLLGPRRNIVVSFLNSINNEYGESIFISKMLIWITNIIVKKKNITKIFKDRLPTHITNNCYYLPNGVDMTKFYPMPKSKAKNELGLLENKRYILFVSSKYLNRKQKRYDKFRNIMSKLKQEFNDVEELVLVGEPRDRINYYFNAAEFHLLTSDFEGSPNSVKEAMACNTPIISTPVGNVPSMLQDVPSCRVSSSFEENELYVLARSLLMKSPSKVNTRSYLTIKNLDMQSTTEKLYQIYKTI